MGLPFYGRGWQGVSPSNDGLYQNATGPAQAGTWEPGVFDYSDIVNNYLDTYEVFRHPEAQVPWLYNPSTGVMISYDDPQSLELKATYAKNRGLGGVMFWELSSDTQNSELLWSIYEPLSVP
jgi:chitinase